MIEVKREDLKPCPFCGKKPRLYEFEACFRRDDSAGRGYRVMHYPCVDQAVNFAKVETAVKHWNTRK